MSTAARQRRLLSILACPTCSRPLEIHRSIERFGCVVDARMTCSGCGTVGVITGYRPTFHHDVVAAADAVPGTYEATVDLRLPELHTGCWTEVHEGMLGEDIGSSISAPFVGGEVSIAFRMHPWSGRVRVVGGDHEEIVDLYSPFPVDREVRLPAPATRPATWCIQIVDGGHPDRLADQAIVRHVRQRMTAATAPPPPSTPENLGNPYPTRFEELLTAAPPDAVVLDIGGGDRRHRDPRVFNFEYLDFPRADFFGDGLELPVRDGSVDLVLSQAVLEHVPDPQRAASEIARVLKPGGVVYAEIAFMQPLHAVPHHFFNATSHGARQLFAGMDVLSLHTKGGLAETVAWMLRLTDGEGRLGSATVVDIVTSLEELDAELTQHELDHVASYVVVEARARS